MELTRGRRKVNGKRSGYPNPTLFPCASLFGRAGKGLSLQDSAI